MTIALYPASFDPITFGHIDIAERAARLFEKVVVAVFDKPLKNLTFSPEMRHEMTQIALAHLKNVDTVQYSGLTVNFAGSVGANVIIRGLRTVEDLEKERQLSMANQTLAPEIDTVCLITSPNHAFISSSLVKEIAMNDGDVSHLVPDHVVLALAEIYNNG